MQINNRIVGTDKTQNKQNSPEDNEYEEFDPGSG
jgi:hypothetical protein